MNRDVKPVPPADARAAVAEAKLARLLARIATVTKALELGKKHDTLTIGEEGILQDLRAMVAEART